MPLQAGKMYRPTDIALRTSVEAVYVVEHRNHRVSKWNFANNTFNFKLDAGEIDTTIQANIDQPGEGYAFGDQIIFPPPDLDIADPIQATAQVLTVNGASMDEILSIQINNVGNGYSGEFLTSTDIISDDGMNGQVRVTMAQGWGKDGNGLAGVPGTTTQQVISATITEGGDDYTSTPFVTFSGGGATEDAEGIANLNGGVEVVSITITNGGAGYTSAPTITFMGGGASTEATAVANLEDHLNHPTGIVQDSDFLYVTDTQNHRLQIIDAATGFFKGNTSSPGQGDNQLYRPAYIAFSDSSSPDLLIVSDSFNSRAVRYDVTTADQPAFLDIADAPSEGYHTPFGSMYTPIGTDAVYVSDLIKGKIAEYDGTAGNTPVFRGTPGTDSAVPSQFFYPSNGHEPGGNQIFADSRNNAIKEIVISGGAVLDIIISDPGITDGKLYWPDSVFSFSLTQVYLLVVNTLNNRIEVFDFSVEPPDFENNFGSPGFP